MDVVIMQALVFNKMEIRPWDAAVYIGYQAVEYSIFSHYHTSLPMEVGSMYQIVLRPRGPQMGYENYRPYAEIKWKSKLETQ